MSRIYTEEGLKKLETELEERKTATRIAIAQAIKEAKEQGDLSENAEYSEAKRQQDENENRIMELETLLRDAILADTNTKGSEIGMGSKLTVKLGNKELAFEIVGSNEVDPGVEVGVEVGLVEVPAGDVPRRRRRGLVLHFGAPLAS